MNFLDWIFKDNETFKNCLTKAPVNREKILRKAILPYHAKYQNSGNKFCNNVEYEKYLVTLIKYEIYHCTLVHPRQTVTGRVFSIYYEHSMAEQPPSLKWNVWDNTKPRLIDFSLTLEAFKLLTKHH